MLGGSIGLNPSSPGGIERAPREDDCAACRVLPSTSPNSCSASKMVAPAAPCLAESEEERLGRCGSGRAGGSGDGNSAMLLAPAVDDGLIVIVGDVGVVEDDTSGDVSNGMRPFFGMDSPQLG